MIYPAVITAGGRVDGPFAAALGADVKALAPFRDTTVLDLTIAALRGAGVERIALVGGSLVRARCERLVERFIGEAHDGAENQRRALRAWEPQEPLLYVAGDMPYITTAALRSYLDTVPPDTLSVPLTPFADFTRRFPGAPPFGITLGGEKVVNGGVFALPAGAAPIVEKVAMDLFNARKSPLRMARLTGPALLFQFLFRRLSIAQLEKQAERVLGIPAKAVLDAPAELAYDIDTLREYEYALAHP